MSRDTRPVIPYLPAGSYHAQHQRNQREIRNAALVILAAGGAGLWLLLKWMGAV